MTISFLPKDTVLKDAYLKLKTRGRMTIVHPPKPWDAKLSAQLTGGAPAKLFSKKVADVQAAKAVVSGLLLWNDDLAGAHTLAQDIPTPVGSYWHGVMHRRDGDFWNAKYWFNSAGKLPVFTDIAREIRTIFADVLTPDEQWDPKKFTDMLERLDEHSPEYDKYQQVLTVEIENMLAYCYRLAYADS